jgi:hypothetical protein
LDRRDWLDRGDGVFVDDLRLAISREKNAKDVERSHIALKLDAVLEKHSHGNLAILKVTEKYVLDRLNPFYCHMKLPFLILVIAKTAGASL